MRAPQSSRSDGDGHWRTMAVVAAVVFVAATRLLITGRAVGVMDVDGQYFPRFVFVADHVRAGQFVRWDPWTDGGLPSFSEPQVGAFSPIVNAFGLFFGGNQASFIAYWLVHWALGGAGIFVLARHLRAPAWGACVVALGYLFSGVYTGHAQHTTFVAGLSWLPWIIWQLDHAVERRSLRHAVHAGAIWGIGALAGHPSITILTGGFAALWALGTVLFGADVRLAHAVKALGIMALVGVIVLSPTYVGELMEGRGVHSRSQPLSRVESEHNEFPPGGLVTLASAQPARIKAFFPNAVWPWTHVSMASVYSGVLIPLLALCAMVARWRDRWLWWILAVGLLALGAAMGQSLPIRAWLYDWVYPTRFFRHSAVFRLFFVFPLAVLALHGSAVVQRAIASESRVPWKRFLIGSALGAGAAIAGYEWFLSRLEVPTGRAAPILVITWLAPVAIAAAGLTRRELRRWIPAALVVVASLDALLTERLSRIMVEDDGDNAIRWRALAAQHRRSLDLTQLGLGRSESVCQPWSPSQCWRNDQLITKEPTLRGYATFTNDYHYRMSRDPVLRRAASGSDRMWFASVVAMAPATDSVFEAFIRQADSLGAPPLIVHARAEMLRAGSGAANERSFTRMASVPAAQRIAVQLLTYRPNELTLRLSAPDSGWVMVTDRWAPGWRTTVNAQPVSTFGADFIFRAVRVQRGANVMHFSYEPAGYPWLLILSWLTLAAVAAWSVTAAIRAAR